MKCSLQLNPQKGAKMRIPDLDSLKYFTGSKINREVIIPKTEIDGNKIGDQLIAHPSNTNFRDDLRGHIYTIVAFTNDTYNKISAIMQCGDLLNKCFTSVVADLHEKHIRIRSGNTFFSQNGNSYIATDSTNLAGFCVRDELVWKNTAEVPQWLLSQDLWLKRKVIVGFTNSAEAIVQVDDKYHTKLTLDQLTSFNRKTSVISRNKEFHSISNTVITVTDTLEYEGYKVGQILTLKTVDAHPLVRNASKIVVVGFTSMNAIVKQLDLNLCVLDHLMDTNNFFHNTEIIAPEFQHLYQTTPRGETAMDSYFLPDIVPNQQKILTDNEVDYTYFTNVRNTQLNIGHDGIIINDKSSLEMACNLLGIIVSAQYPTNYDGLLWCSYHKANDTELATQVNTRSTKIRKHSWNTDTNPFIAIIREHLFPYLPETIDTVVLEDANHTYRAPTNNSTEFRILNWATPSETQQLELPSLIFARVRPSSTSYAQSNLGFVISCPYTKHDVAELIGNDLYILFYICPHGSANELEIFQEIIIRVAKFLQMPEAEQRAYEKKLFDRNKIVLISWNRTGDKTEQAKVTASRAFHEITGKFSQIRITPCTKEQIPLQTAQRADRPDILSIYLWAGISDTTPSVPSPKNIFGVQTPYPGEAGFFGFDASNISYVIFDGETAIAEILGNSVYVLHSIFAKNEPNEQKLLEIIFGKIADFYKLSEEEQKQAYTAQAPIRDEIQKKAQQLKKIQIVTFGNMRATKAKTIATIYEALMPIIENYQKIKFHYGNAKTLNNDETTAIANSDGCLNIYLWAGIAESNPNGKTVKSFKEKMFDIAIPHYSSEPRFTPSYKEYVIFDDDEPIAEIINDTIIILALVCFENDPHEYQLLSETLKRATAYYVLSPEQKSALVATQRKQKKFRYFNLSSYDQFRTQLTSSAKTHLVPFLPDDIHILNFSYDQVKVKNEHKAKAKEFSVHLYACPEEQIADQVYCPKTLLGIAGTDTDYKAFTLEGENFAVIDDDTKFIVAELIGNDLYIGLPILRFHHGQGYSTSISLCEKIFQQISVFLRMTPEELKLYHEEKLKRNRDRYISITLKRLDTERQEHLDKINKNAEKIQSMEKELIELRRSQAKSSRELQMLDNENDTFRAKLAEEFDAIIKFSKIVDIKITSDGNYLVCTTKTIYARHPQTKKYHQIGAFKIIMSTHGRIDAKIVTFINLTKTIVGYNGDNFYAPHVSATGHPCLGTIEGTLPQLIASYDFSAAIILCIGFLEQVNIHDNWGRHIDKWVPILDQLPTT
ncbi:hypothetical protein A2223_02130 [Candidatus Falkowbacteria bacterium RIFOXYA2_FULL_35_8]|nr:MAG: hypothetical protein A2223_02130 [Candidatus Falkowbacteria bacterium RIFOXYA2_FULL_35_8]